MDDHSDERPAFIRWTVGDVIAALGFAGTVFTVCANLYVRVSAAETAVARHEASIQKQEALPERLTRIETKLDYLTGRLSSMAKSTPPAETWR